MPDTLREELEAAMAAQEAPEPEVEAPVEQEAAPEPEPTETATERAERLRDERGRFAAKPEDGSEAAPKSAQKPVAATKAGAPGPAKAGGVEPPTTPPAAAVEPAPVKAPQSWKPQVRELAAKLPAEYRPILDEVNRREVETNRVMQESAEARKVAQQTYQALAPYEGIARAAGSDAWSWAGQALQERAVLQMGSPQQKAQVLARFLAEGGEPLVQAVAAVLDGQAPQAAPQQYQQPVNIQAEVQKVLQAQIQQAQATKAERDIEAFKATNPEFLADVAQDMIALFETAGRQGRNLTPQEAYDRACWMNPDVREILEKRKTVEAAKANAPSVAQARRAAVSVKASPAEPVKGKQDRSLREELEAAAAAATRT